MSTNGTKTWLAAGLAAAALLVAARPAAALDNPRPAMLNPSKAVQGLWISSQTDENGALQVIRLQLADGRFTLKVEDDHGHVVQQQAGRFTYKAGALTLSVPGESEPYAQLLVTLGDETMDVSCGALKSHWVKEEVIDQK